MQSFAMRTDLYQLTMAEGYWKLGKHQQRAVFDLFFREHPFQGGYTIACGLETVVDLLKGFYFTQADIDYLRTIEGNDKEPLFQPDFLKALLDFSLTVDVDAIPEGTVVFPREPLLRVEGPLWECQIIETLLLNLINFPTLIATKASRVWQAAGGLGESGADPIIEFGLRRAQGPDGGLTATRASFVGGVTSTSNVLAGKMFGIPVKGTHAHSWVMAFDSELESFEAYAKAMPNNAVFLVDTFDSIKGVEHAIEVGLTLKATGHNLIGIRLDSGDLASLSIESRKMLDNAGFTEAIIIGSNDLDEYAISDLKARGAKIDTWGVGTRMVTGYDQPALGGVYKLVAIMDRDGKWQIKSKSTNDPKKSTVGGIHQVQRVSKKGQFIRDYIYHIDDSYEQEKQELLSKIDAKMHLEEDETAEDLLVPVFRQGQLVYHLPSLKSIQKRTKSQVKSLPESVRQLKPTSEYPVILL